MKKLNIIPVLCLAAALAMGACGDAANRKPAAETGHAQQGQLVTLEANDQMQYSKTEIRAMSGKPLRLTFTNTGRLDKNIMAHNFVLLKAGTDPDAFAHVALNAAKSDFIPVSESSHVIVHTRLLGGGESDTIEFRVPEKGVYDFLCTFPGHSAVMKGKFIAE